MKQPIFEITDKGERYEIFADGNVNGFSEDAVIVNRIPETLARLCAATSQQGEE